MQRDKSDSGSFEINKCKHETAEYVGLDHGMRFLRCLTCRSVIISQDGMSLAIPPVRKVS